MHSIDQIQKVVSLLIQDEASGFQQPDAEPFGCWTWWWPGFSNRQISTDFNDGNLVAGTSFLVQRGALRQSSGHQMAQRDQFNFFGRVVSSGSFAACSCRTGRFNGRFGLSNAVTSLPRKRCHIPATPSYGALNSSVAHPSWRCPESPMNSTRNVW